MAAIEPAHAPLPILRPTCPGCGCLDALVVVKGQGAIYERVLRCRECGAVTVKDLRAKAKQVAMNGHRA